ncbi:class I SAM-dependent methyltransferase [Bernardetia sp. MNP-M8]|uniref:class I SAM-dependent methyltransferase n=1 Tax=Bernardetia sp. MNP-M8 TaxID=3127470 RepID=UPI0030CCA894
MNSKQLINRDIELFYEKASEETRLEKGMGVFEFERVKTLITKYLPLSSSVILDIGGGTGKYAEWLSQKTHIVHLVEPVRKHVKIAISRANKLKNKYSVHLGKAQSLDFPTNFADIVLLHGPLYHLQNQEEREKAILEAKRVVKPNGIILGFAINYTASTLVGLLQGLIHKQSFFEMCKEEITKGIHNPPYNFPWLLAEAYYHTPKQLKEEFENQELICLNMYAVEGIIWLDKNYFANMLNSKKRQTLLELLELTQNDSNLLSISPHIMIAAQKLKT